MTERTKAAREWLGVETSEQLIRLRKQLGLSFDEMEAESELHERTDQATKEAAEALRQLRSSVTGIENQVMLDILKQYDQAMELVVKAKDLNTAALLDELTDALEKREND